MILVIGEILFDVFPNYRRLGGAPFNFAYHLKNFGFDVRFISRIGKDGPGKEILHKLGVFRFDLQDIQLDDAYPTGSVVVHLDKSGSPRFDILSDVAYDHIEFIPEHHMELINEAQLVYFGSLIQRNPAGHENLQKFISANASETLKFYDINLRPGCYNRDIIIKSLAKTDILKLSVEELAELKRMLSVNEEQEAFVQYLMEEYALNTVSLTKGSDGSELFTGRGSFVASTTEAVKVIDSVGAGDAYAAMMAAGILNKWQPPEILRQAARFASRVCEIKGAIPESTSFYEPFRPLFMQ